MMEKEMTDEQGPVFREFSGRIDREHGAFDMRFLDSLIRRAQEAKKKGAIEKWLDRDKLKEIAAEWKPQTIEGGLAEDWAATSATIYDGESFLGNEFGCEQSLWATPIAIIDGKAYECWTKELKTADVARQLMRD